MAKASGEKSARCSSGSLMRLEAVRDVVLARVPLADHRALGQTCKALRRLVNSDGFAKLRKTQGYEECGLLLLGGSVLMGDRWKHFACLTHNLKSLSASTTEIVREAGLVDKNAGEAKDAYLFFMERAPDYVAD